jgi:hypothetical protein
MASRAQLSNYTISYLEMMKQMQVSQSGKRFSSLIYPQNSGKSIFRKQFDNEISESVIPRDYMSIPNGDTSEGESSPKARAACSHRENISQELERPKLQRKKSISLTELSLYDKTFLQNNILTTVKDSQKLLRRYHSFAGPRTSDGTHVDTSDGLLTTTLCSTEL